WIRGCPAEGHAVRANHGALRAPAGAAEGPSLRRMSLARSLFSCLGIELEYMVVRSTDLGVAPWADRVLVDAAGHPVSDVERGDLSWSNELIAHVIEIKTTDPASSPDGLAARFAAEI